MTGFSIHVTGIVQGVGFRPWVWKRAEQQGVQGSVRNDFDGVHIEWFGDAAPLLDALKSEPPPLSRIDRIHVSEISDKPCAGFNILSSESTGEALQRISPDIALCADCRRELMDPADRRYRYPFINCVNCGPRFSIIKNLPYDRPKTSMQEFEMCSACRAEYTDPSNRRYHAQPIACPACGPQVEVCRADSQSQSAHGAGATWEHVWKRSMEQGKIVAVKGVGGFHLACDALHPSAVELLRNRKKREAKPFALMVPNLEWVKTVAEVSVEEERLLLSRERPIVLLKLKTRDTIPEQIAPGLDTLGVMLPYSPMHEIMFDLFPHPVVMTSANYSSEPMIHQNERAKERLAGIADVVILHNREIINRCDDPVCAVHGTQTIVIRPGRGIAPLAMPIESDACILAFGADMKNCFALAHHGQITLHPYIGDLAHPEAESILATSIARQLACFKLKPDLIVHDQHPDYFSTALARAYAEKQDIPTLAVQHHHAHLIGAHPGPAIGFAFDGTGYGTDQTIWGGEVLFYGEHTFERVFHLRPFALPGGDAAVKNPQRTLDALLFQLNRLDDSPVKTMLEAEVNCPLTSSMGRLFDAVACLLGVCDAPSYDGESAMRLEAVAEVAECGDLAFGICADQIDWRPLITDLIEETQKGVSAGILSARFHNTLAEIIYCCAKKLTVQQRGLPLVFAGGVFQNRLLVNRIKKVAGNEFKLIFSSYPNDSGIALGQAIIGAKQWALK